MKVIKTDLKEVLIMEYEERDDSRGRKYSTFSQRELVKFGIDFKYVEENILSIKSWNCIWNSFSK